MARLDSMEVSVAKWIVFRLPGSGNDRVLVEYLNQHTGVKHAIGSLASDGDDGLVTSWILSHGLPAEGDLVELSDGNSLLFSGSRLLVREVRLDDGVVVAIRNQGRA